MHPCRCCTGEAPVTGAEALRVLRTIFAFYEAAESRKTVAVLRDRNVQLPTLNVQGAEQKDERSGAAR